MSRGEHSLNKSGETIDSLTEATLKQAWPMLGRQNRLVLYLLIVKGLSTKQVAELLKISPRTVDEYKWQAHLKAHAASARQAYGFYAIRFYQEHQRTLSALKKPQALK